MLEVNNKDTNLGKLTCNQNPSAFIRINLFHTTGFLLYTPENIRKREVF